MNKIEFVKAVYNENDPDQHSHFSDDFQWTDELGNPPMDKSTWIAMGGLVRSAFPDMSLIIDAIREEGDDVVVTSHYSGTFTNDFDLSPLGLDVVPATGKAVRFPPATNRVSFDNGSISRMHGLDTGPDAGLAGFLKALGADMG